MTTQELINELRQLQSQIIHGTDFFGKAADHVQELQELLRSASTIAAREGHGTHWERFAASIAEVGIGPVTARTYRILPSDMDADATERKAPIDHNALHAALMGMTEEEWDVFKSKVMMACYATEGKVDHAFKLPLDTLIEAFNEATKGRCEK